MIAERQTDQQISKLPQPKRKRPKDLPKSPQEEPCFPIDKLELTGRQWAKLLSLLCSVIRDDEYLDLEVIKIAAQQIDGHLQSTPAFLAELKQLRATGGEEIEELISKLDLVPWER